MKLLRNTMLAGAILFAQNVVAQDYDTVVAAKVNTYDSITKASYTLVFMDQTPDLDTTVKRRMIDAFFEVYPKEASLYNPKTLKKVRFIIDPNYDGVAATWNGTVHYNPDWLKKHPEDIDVVTHEVMHIVQDYPDLAGPGWITEGIADYVRYKLGVDNVGWKLPEYKSTQNFDNAYRVTARFFVWIEQTKKVDIVKQLDEAMRTKKYKSALWKTITGKTVEELWVEYAKNPVIETISLK